MTDAEVRDRLRVFVCRELLRDPAYPLGDDEPLVSGGLIDSFALAHIGVFIESAFGDYVPDVELTVEAMDTLRLIAQRVMRDVPA